MKKETKDLLKAMISEEIKRTKERDALLEQKNKLEKELALLNEDFTKNGGYDESEEESLSMDEVKVGDNGEAEFKMKGSHLVEDGEENKDEIWTKMEEEFENLAMEWSDPEMATDNTSSEESQDHLGEVPPSEDIRKESSLREDLSEKMSPEDVNEIETSLKEQESLNESAKRRRILAGIDRIID